MNYKIITSILFSLSILGCNQSKVTSNHNQEKTTIVDKKENLEYKVLKYNQYGANVEGENSIIKSENEFKSIWNAVHQKSSPIADIPSVDFEKNNVIYIDFGQKSHGGYQYNVKNIDVNHSEITVYITSPKMEKDGLYTTVMTRPFMFIAIEKTNATQIKVIQ